MYLYLLDFVQGLFPRMADMLNVEECLYVLQTQRLLHSDYVFFLLSGFYRWDSQLTLNKYLPRSSLSGSEKDDDETRGND